MFLLLLCNNLQLSHGTAARSTCLYHEAGGMVVPPAHCDASHSCTSSWLYIFKAHQNAPQNPGYRNGNTCMFPIYHLHGMALRVA